MTKEKIVIRLLPEIYDVLERYAAWTDKKVSTLIAEILHEQCEKARRAGESEDCKKYALSRVGVEMIPSNRNKGKSSTSQISIRLSAEDVVTLNWVTKNNPEGLRIVNGEVTYTYRKIIPGMLLNDKMFDELSHGENRLKAGRGG